MVVVSVLYREPKLLKVSTSSSQASCPCTVSVLYREPKLLKAEVATGYSATGWGVSVLYREPKLLKAGVGAVENMTAIEMFQCSTVSRNC